MSIPSSRLEKRRKYAERQGVSTKTIERWVRKGIVKEPLTINGHHYHDPDDKPHRDAVPRDCLDSDYVAEIDRLRALNTELVAALELIIDDVGCGYTVRELTKQMLRAVITKAKGEA